MGRRREGGGGGGGGGGGDYRAEVDEGWLLDRMSARKKAFFNSRDMYPRSPSPAKAANADREAQNVPEKPQMTREEEERNEKFQAGIKQGLKAEAKEMKKKEKQDKKEKGSEDEGKDKKEKEEKGKKSKKDKKAKGSDDEAEKDVGEKKDTKDK